MTVKAVKGFPVPHQSTREPQYRARNTKKTITNGLPHSRQLAEFFADEFDPDADLMCSCDCSTNFQKPCLPGRAPSERVRCYKAREWQLVGRTRPIHDSVHLVWPNDGRGGLVSSQRNERGWRPYPSIPSTGSACEIVGRLIHSSLVRSRLGQHIFYPNVRSSVVPSQLAAVGVINSHENPAGSAHS